MLRAHAVVLMLVGLAFVACPAVAAALPGPPLTESRAALDRALSCSGPLTAGGPAPALLIHGGNGGAGAWDGNYGDVLPAGGRPVCRVEIPGRGVEDVQRSIEYVVDAIRRVHERAGRPIAVIGHSHGGLLASYALRFWPDLADRVDDVVTLAAVFANGTAASNEVCVAACPVAARQIAPGSRFLRAYARRPLYDGPTYTSIATAYDELVRPQPAASHLDGATNILLQDICPGRYVGHVGIVFDGLAYALVQDALTHPGPTVLRRLESPCSSPPMFAGANPAAVTPEVVRFGLGLETFVEQRNLPEPKLRCYIDPECAHERLHPTLAVIARATRTSRPVVRSSGLLELPPGALERCAGPVRLRLTSAGRTLARGHAQLRRDCSFTLEQRIRRRSDRRRVRAVRVHARFAGTSELLPARAQSRPIRLTTGMGGRSG